MCEGGVEESVVLEHSGADSAGEFFNLLFDVGEESVGAPSSDEHDGVDWFFGKEHHHGKGGSYQMGINIFTGEAKDVGSDTVH